MPWRDNMSHTFLKKRVLKEDDHDFHCKHCWRRGVVPSSVSDNESGADDPASSSTKAQTRLLKRVTAAQVGPVGPTEIASDPQPMAQGGLWPTRRLDAKSSGECATNMQPTEKLQQASVSSTVNNVKAQMNLPRKVADADVKAGRSGVDPRDGLATPPSEDVVESRGT